MTRHRLTSLVTRPARRLFLTGLAAVTLGLGGCVTWPQRHTVTEDQLSARLASQLTTPRGWLGAIDMVLGQPSVVAEPARNRLRTEVDLRSGPRAQIPGMAVRVRIFAGVRFHAQDHSLRLQQVSIEAAGDDHQDIDARRLGRVVDALLAPMLEGLVVYQLPPAQVRQLRDEGLAVQDLRVTASGLQFTLGRAQ